jgi:hypothetical protein
MSLLGRSPPVAIREAVVYLESKRYPFNLLTVGAASKAARPVIIKAVWVIGKIAAAVHGILDKRFAARIL